MESKRLTADRFIDHRTGCSYRYVYSETEYFRPHDHDYFEVFVVLEGSALHKVNGAEIKISKGSLVFIRPSDVHDYICEHGKGFSMLNIMFTAETVESLFEYLGPGFPSEELMNTVLPPEVSLTDVDFKRLENRMSNIRAIDPKSYEMLKTSMRILLFDILTRYFSNYKANSVQMPLWLEEMCSEIKKNGNFTLGTEYFFSLSNKTREHVSRCMKRYTHMTASEFINSLRLNYIANMLRNSNHSITEIIYESGFNNISWASEVFKKKYGISMHDYRANLKSRDAQRTNKTTVNL